MKTVAAWNLAAGVVLAVAARQVKLRQTAHGHPAFHFGAARKL